jgi:hypothetical protein
VRLTASACGSSTSRTPSRCGAEPAEAARDPSAPRRQQRRREPGSEQAVKERCRLPLQFAAMATKTWHELRSARSAKDRAFSV